MSDETRHIVELAALVEIWLFVAWAFFAAAFAPEKDQPQ